MKHHRQNISGCSKCTNTSPSEKEAETSVPGLAAAACLFVAALIFEKLTRLPVQVSAALYAASVFFAGACVFLNGFRAMLKLKINENTLMSVAMIAAFATSHFSEAAITAILFGVGEMLEERAVDKSRGSIQKLIDIRPDTAHRLTENEEETIPAREVGIGDIIIVRPFEHVPLDGKIVDGVSTLDAAAITGESLPIDAQAETEVLSGMINGSGILKISVTNSFKNSTASRILSMVESASARKGHTEKFITRFAEIYTPVIIVAAAVLAIFPPLLGLGDFQAWLYRALVFLVASCPCALVISIPLSFYAGLGLQSRGGVLIKGGRFLEVLSKAKAVVFDKTGTLTSGKLSVNNIAAAPGYSAHEVLAAAAAVERHSNHPAAKAINEAAKGFELPITCGAAEIPGKGVAGTISGKTVLCGRRDFLEERGADFTEFAENASVYISIGNKTIGGILLCDTPKAGSSAAVAALQKLGICRIVMLTGDNKKSAAAAADECGITEYKAGLLPDGKVEELEQIRRESGTTVFVGDGINDAPSIAAADCGIAVGLGTDAAIETADAVLTFGNLSALAPAIAVSRRVMRITRFNICFALIIKAAVLVLAVFGAAEIWAAVFADVGVCILTVLNSVRILNFKVKD